MGQGLSARQLTGRDESHLVTLACGHRLQAEAATAFAALQEDARAAGFQLTIASSFRSFARQLAIWNGKACGQRAVYDETGRPLPMATLTGRERLQAILRYSAIPGSSRHHWGTDLDIYDAAAVAADYRLQLSEQEVAPGGVFDPMHCWLDGLIAAGASRGFYRPYALDTGGVAPERWHLSYRPLARQCAAQLTSAVLVSCWDEADELLLREEIDRQLPEIMARYMGVDQPLA